MRTILAAALVSTGIFGAACGFRGEDEVSTGDLLQSTNLGTNDFGLQPKEILLTLDDGPGPRTVELAEFLAREKIPAVFFMVGKNARANPTAVRRIAELSAQVPGGLIVANHSMTHTTPLPKQGTAGATKEVLDADAILSQNIQASQAQFANAYPFFRPPYGAFKSLGQANIARINQGGASKYIGPVFWNIGGELTDKHSADWACWGKVTVARCTDGYRDETLLRGRGILLAHDVHAKTVDMLTGVGTAGGRSLLKELRDRHGFKFVGARAHEDALLRFASEEERRQAQGPAGTQATVTPTAGGVRVAVPAPPAGRAVVTFDNEASASATRAQGLSPLNVGTTSIERKLAPGQHFVTVAIVGDAGHVLALERYPFVVAADIEPTSEEANTSYSACSQFSQWKPGSGFHLFYDKTACGAGTSPVAEGECYAQTLTLSVGAVPKLVGAGEWDIRMNASHGISGSVGLVVDAAHGEVVTGHATLGTGLDADILVDADQDGIDCEKGIWRGTFRLPDGRDTDFVLSMDSLATR